MQFRSPSRRQKMFQDALARETKKSKKRTDRSESFRTRFPYGVISLWILFVGVVGYCVLLSPLLLISQIEIRNHQDVTEDEARTVVESILNTKRFFVLPARNLLILPIGMIEERLRELSPLVEQVSTTRIFPDAVQVSLKERSELLYWCAGGPCALVNENGEAWAHEKGFEARYDSKRLVVVDTSALPIEFGQPLPVQEYLQYFSQFEHDSQNELGVTIEPQATTPSRYSRELRLVATEGWTLLVNIDIPFEETMLGLRSFLAEQKKQNTNPSFTSIDARVPGRIFFSVRADESSLGDTTKETSSKEE